MATSNNDESVVWLLFGALAIWVAYDKWWKVEDPPTPPPPAHRAFEPYPEGPLARLDDGTEWRMVWGKLKGPRENRLAWVRADHSKNKSVAARETMTLYQIDCDTTGLRTLSVVDYDKDGKVLNQWGENVFTKEPTYPPPGSYIEHVTDGACLSRFDKLGDEISQPPKP